MKPCEKCNQLTAILIEEPAKTPDQKDVWVCAECYVLDESEEAFERAMEQAGISYPHMQVH